MNLYMIVNLDLEKGHSITPVVITFVKKVAQAIEKGKYVAGVFLDLNKAFDTVNHNYFRSLVFLESEDLYTNGNFVSYESTDSDTQK